MSDINTMEDLMCMLDRYTEGVDWDAFYTKRDKPAPFLRYNRVPDRCLVAFLEEHDIQNACEFGCGEGRNAVYLAQNHIVTDACDLSEAAIENARKFAGECGAENVVFRAGNIFELDWKDKKYDLVLDSGIFHHLPPHRRLQYRDLAWDILADKGCFILLCFAAGGGGAEEVDDYAFYKSRQTGTAFTEERLRKFWGEKFDIMELRKGEDIAEPRMWESRYLYICVMRKREKFFIEKP